MIVIILLILLCISLIFNILQYSAGKRKKLFPKKAFTYLAIGNSLTLHGKCSYWWDDRRGMASSEPEKDFVHLVAAYLKKIYGNVAFTAFNFYAWEVQAHDRAETLSLLEKYFEVPPDLITLQLGENVRDMTTFAEDFESLVRWITEHAPKAKVILVDDFFIMEERTECKRKVAEKYSCGFADLSMIAGKEEFRCPLGSVVKDDQGLPHPVEHKGVSLHPGDAGMEAIAGQIIRQICGGKL